MMCIERPILSSCWYEDDMYGDPFFISDSANLVSSFIFLIELVRILSFLLISLKKLLCQFSLFLSNYPIICCDKCKIFTVFEALLFPLFLCALENTESPSRIVLILKYSSAGSIGSISETMLPLNTFLHAVSSHRLYLSPKITLKSSLRRLLMTSQ